MTRLRLVITRASRVWIRAFAVRSRQRIIATTWQAAALNALIAQLLGRVYKLLDQVDFAQLHSARTWPRREQSPPTYCRPAS